MNRVTAIHNTGTSTSLMVVNAGTARHLQDNMTQPVRIKCSLKNMIRLVYWRIDVGLGLGVGLA